VSLYVFVVARHLKFGDVVSVVSDEQSRKAFSRIVAISALIVTVITEVQDLNALLPIYVTDEGKSMEVNDLQSWNASS